LDRFPDTRSSLLLRVKNNASDEQAWQEFAELYQPVIIRMAKAKGMQEADAQDLAQQVLVSVHQAIGRWEPRSAETRFRNWLSKITRNAILKALTRSPQDAAVGGSEVREQLADLASPDSQLAQLLEEEVQREIYHRAAEIVQQEVNQRSWQAFQWTTLDEMPIEEAAERLKQTVGNVYAMRSRVMRRLRDVVQSLREIEQ
jgi:RNA polymerase sigma-70 factor (ECF subfamily)